MGHPGDVYLDSHLLHNHQRDAVLLHQHLQVLLHPQHCYDHDNDHIHGSIIYVDHNNHHHDDDHNHEDNHDHRTNDHS